MLVSDWSTLILTSDWLTGIQRRAAGLLLVLVNADNVKSVVDRVLGHIATADSVRCDYTPVIDRVVSLIDKWGDTVQDCDWMANTLLRSVLTNQKTALH